MQVRRPQERTSLPWQESPIELGTRIHRHLLPEKLTRLERRKGCCAVSPSLVAEASGKVTARAFPDAADTGSGLTSDALGHLPGPGRPRPGHHSDPTGGILWGSGFLWGGSASSKSRLMTGQKPGGLGMSTPQVLPGLMLSHRNQILFFFLYGDLVHPVTFIEKLIFSPLQCHLLS